MVTVGEESTQYMLEVAVVKAVEENRPEAAAEGVIGMDKLVEEVNVEEAGVNVVEAVASGEVEEENAVEAGVSCSSKG